MFFLPIEGRIRCGKCEIREPSIELVKGSLTALRHTIYADFDKTFSFSIPDEGVKALNMASESYLARHVEREFKTLDIYKKLLNCH